MPQLVYPPEPAYQEPAAPKGLSGAFGGKKRHEEAVSLARASHKIARRSWHERCTRMHADDVAEAERQQAERDRVGKLAAAEATYQEEFRQRDADAEARNQELSPFSSILAVTVPEPSSIPAVKEYRYVKAKDEIVPTSRCQSRRRRTATPTPCGRSPCAPCTRSSRPTAPGKPPASRSAAGRTGSRRPTKVTIAIRANDSGRPGGSHRMTRQTVIAIEHGHSSPYLEVAFQIARVFDAPLDDVFQYPNKEREGPVKAIVQGVYGVTDFLSLADIDLPSIGHDQVLIRIHAARRSGGQG